MLFADGMRSMDEIRTLVNAPNAGELLYLLEKNGYLSQGKPKQVKADETAVSAMDEIMGQLRPLIAPIIASGIFAKTRSLQTSLSTAMTRPMDTAATSAQPVLGAQTQANQAVERTAPLLDQPEPAQEHTLDENAKLAIKRIIMETSGEHLGIFSRELLDKTEHAQDAGQLRACISQWHMAMQESRSGREKCVDWLNEVNGLFHHGMDRELKSA